jgi:DNA modification methylase
LHHGDALDVLRELPSASVHLCCTSPPFYGLRDYGTDGQIGLEETPDQWVERLVNVFREVRRVLRDDGTLWVEIGDSYTSAASGGAGAPAKQHTNAGSLIGRGTTPPGHKQKDLLGQPWMLAFALRADGWYLRSEIIWARPNPMPESVTDRPTKAHSTIFLLSKKPRYYFDADAVREPHQRDNRKVTTVKQGDGSIQHRNGERWPGSGANARSVWTIPTEPTPFAHFATWPQKLCERMILAGTSERGCCPECGAPWKRDVERVDQGWDGSRYGERHVQANVQTGGTSRSTLGSSGGKLTGKSATLGWLPSCECLASPALMARTGRELVPVPIPCTVLDPFAGSGTTMLVARRHGRHSIGIELNPEYCKLAADRLAQQTLLA